MQLVSNYNIKCFVNISEIIAVTIVGDAERNETALQDVTLSVTIGIRPSFTFTVQWYYNDQQITDNGDYSITNTSSSSSLTILTTVPSDTGTYRVDVTSSVGSDTATINLNIKGELLLTNHVLCKITMSKASINLLPLCDQCCAFTAD